MPTKFQFQIEETIYKNRLDSFLFDEITAVSKMFLRNLIKKDECKINGNLGIQGGYHLKKGDIVEIEIDLEAETAMKPENIAFEIVFEDEEIIVVNKPAGMLVHPTFAQKTGTLLNALAFYLNEQNKLRITNYELREISDVEELRTNDQFKIRNPKSKIIRPGLVHRLDRETSGLMVIAKTKRAHKILSDHFGRKLVEKKYLAVVEGNVENDDGTINAPIGRFEDEKRWGIKNDGKFSETLYRVLKRFSGKTLLELEPVTGRTNQLRIHCAYLGHPIIGDKLYKGREYPRLCLHAAKLRFWHPNGARRMEFESQISF